MKTKKTDKPDPAEARSSRPRRVKTPDETAKPQLPTESDVAGRAYQLFVQRGGQHGHDQEDWLRAEQELRSSDQ